VAAEGHAQNLQNSVLAIKHSTDQIRNELDKTQSIFIDIDKDSFKEQYQRPEYRKGTGSKSTYPHSRYDPLNSKKYYDSGRFDSKLEKYK
jgi:hypothetical protein